MMEISKQKSVAIIGGGASGIFASLRCAEVAKEKNININIQVYEESCKFLEKGRIAGSGRCKGTRHILEING